MSTPAMPTLTIAPPPAIESLALTFRSNSETHAAIDLRNTPIAASGENREAAHALRELFRLALLGSQFEASQTENDE